MSTSSASLQDGRQAHAEARAPARPPLERAGDVLDPLAGVGRHDLEAAFGPADRLAHRDEPPVRVRELVVRELARHVDQRSGHDLGQPDLGGTLPHAFTHDGDGGRVEDRDGVRSDEPAPHGRQSTFHLTISTVVPRPTVD